MVFLCNFRGLPRVQDSRDSRLSHGRITVTSSRLIAHRRNPSAFRNRDVTNSPLPYTNLRAGCPPDDALSELSLGCRADSPRPNRRLARGFSLLVSPQAELQW